MNRHYEKIAFFGDSVTEGCFEIFFKEDGQMDTVRDVPNGYVSKFDSLCKANNKTVQVLNFGISGDNTIGALDRTNKILKSEPDLVVVAFALNDVCFLGHSAFCENLKKIFTAIAETGAKAMYLTPNMMNTYVHSKTLKGAELTAQTTARIQNDGTFDEFINKVKELCASMNVDVIDVYTKWKELFSSGIDTTELLSNYINHPNIAMYELAANTVYQAIFEQNS